MNGLELYRKTLLDDNSHEVELCVIQESSTGLIFAIDASYVEQCINPIKSPYMNGTVVLPEGNDGSEFEPDILMKAFGEKEGTHPEIPLTDWINEVRLGRTRDGYWEYVGKVLRAREKGYCVPYPTRKDVAGVTFSQYGNVVNTVRLEDLIEDSDCVCRVEESGSEGYYVEVIRWSDDHGWNRYVFKKVFELHEARFYEQLINANAATSPVFYTLPQRQASIA